MMAPAALWSAIVTVLAVLLVFLTSFNVARMRGKHGIKAPAMTGHDEMDRAVRVQMNTLEQFAIFLPLLWVATVYFTPFGWLPALAGLIWVTGRFLYMSGYMAAPERRSTGFLISMLANAVLLILSIWGIVTAWMAFNA